MASREGRWELCGPFINTCKRLLSVLLTAEPRWVLYTCVLMLILMGECQNPYNHNPYCVEILIGFLEILIGFLEILIGILEILIGQFRDFIIIIILVLSSNVHRYHHHQASTDSGG